MLFRRQGKHVAGEHRLDEGNTWVIVGLGNPGRRYHLTRHNAGFMVLDRLRDLLPDGASRTRFQAEILETRDGERRVVLVKPQTFMNDSGVAVEQVARWYKVPPERILIICDELDLPFGTLRLRADGSSGGHNGVASVITRLGTDAFPRLRIGIARPLTGSTVPYVLAPFTNSEHRQLPEIIDRAAHAALAWMRDGVTAAMNEFNRKPTTQIPTVAVVAPTPVPSTHPHILSSDVARATGRTAAANNNNKGDRHGGSEGRGDRRRDDGQWHRPDDRAGGPDRHDDRHC